MKALLLKINEQMKRSPTGILDIRWQGRDRKEYHRLISLGLSKNLPRKKKDRKVRRRTAQSKTDNLLVRLRDNVNEVLRFMTSPEACFTNNQAERDLRMNKVRQKVSGGFRSKTAAEQFMTIRPFVATAVKRGADPLEELVKVFTPGEQDYMRLACNPE
jgi:transposase